MSYTATKDDIVAGYARERRALDRLRTIKPGGEISEQKWKESIQACENILTGRYNACIAAGATAEEIADVVETEANAEEIPELCAPSEGGMRFTINIRRLTMT